MEDQESVGCFKEVRISFENMLKAACSSHQQYWGGVGGTPVPFKGEFEKC